MAFLAYCAIISFFKKTHFLKTPFTILVFVKKIKSIQMKLKSFNICQNYFRKISCDHSQIFVPDKSLLNSRPKKGLCESVHRNRHLKFRNLKIKNLQFSQFFQNQFEKNCKNFFNF